MRLRVGICVSLALVAAPAAAGTDRLTGTWVGERDGQVVQWNFSDPGRLRANGRPADYTVADDTLVVRFDPPIGILGEGEKAVYGILASLPKQGRARLFVYGFDLGKVGLWLERQDPSNRLPEDAAPPVPNRTKTSPTSGHGATPSTSASENR